MSSGKKFRDALQENNPLIIPGTAPTGLKGPNGETMPTEMLLYAPGPGYDTIRSPLSLFAADWMQQLGV
jgi:hypothetical protein